MALARVKTWSAEVLTFSDLNAEFNNILNNPVSLISPLTAALDLDGQTITLDAAAATSFVSSAGCSWSFTSGAKSGTPATTGSVCNYSAQTFTDSATAGSGTAAAFTAFAIQRPTLAATNASVVTTDAAVWYIPNNVAAGTNETITNSWAIWVDAGNVRFDDDIHWLSGQTFAQRGILAHANTDVRTYTFPDASGTVAITSGVINPTIVDAKGDLIVGTAADTAARMAVGADGTVPIANSNATAGLSYVAALTKGIFGLTYANNSGDATNDIDFAAGGCADSTGAAWMTCAAMTKRLDADWVAGTNQGMRNSAAAIADVGYYLWAVGTATGGTQDYYAHASATAATVLTALQAETGGSGYAYLRLVGYILRASAALLAFTTYETEGGGIELLWNSPTLDINLANTLTTTRRTDAVKVPLLFQTIANLNVLISDASGNFMVWVYCPDQADLTPSTTATPLGSVYNPSATAPAVSNMMVRTSAAGLVAAKSSAATVDLYAVVTNGFTWARRN